MNKIIGIKGFESRALLDTTCYAHSSQAEKVAMYYLRRLFKHFKGELLTMAVWKKSNMWSCGDSTIFDIVIFGRV